MLDFALRAFARGEERLERLVPFGKYFLLERINVGGMAEVFKAKTVGVEGFEKVVAIKRILPSVAEDEDFIKMFVDEAKITVQLSHANLAQTFDLGRIDDSYYIAMEYVPGKDMRAAYERLKRRGERVPAHIAAYVMARVCDGLDYAHRKRGADGRELGIVHRDVSPQNIIVSFEGEVKLVDFGIAKAANKITKTQAGILKGKFGYMSPEQVRGLPLDRRSDIFAAGVVLYELLTGERLFTGTSDFSVLEKVQAARIVPPTQLQKDIPAALEKIILKALAREVEDRYQYAADLGADLSRFLLEARGRSVTRDDVAAFMKATFPQENVREQAALEKERTGPSQRAPAKKPPPLPPPPAEARPEPVEKTQPSVFVPPKGPPPAAVLEQEGDETTRPMSMDDLAAAERAYAAQMRRDADRPDERTRPRPEDLTPVPGPPPLPGAPPASEARVRHSRPPPPLPASLLADGPALKPGAPAPPKPDQADHSYDVTDPGVEIEAMARAEAPPPAKSDPDRTNPAAPPAPVAAPPVQPPVSLSRPPPTPIGRTRTEPPAARSEGRATPPQAAVPRAMRFQDRPPFGARIAPIKPTLVSDDALPGHEPTTPTLTIRARIVRALLYAVIGVALAVTAWALFSAAKAHRKPTEGLPLGSLTVVTDPEDAIVLLDGAQVKDPLDREWSEQRLSARSEHRVTVRRDGFEEQSLAVLLADREHKRMEVKLKPLPGQLTVRSNPSGARVFLDGQERGQTPLHLADIDQSQAHAIVLEKRCYNAWQLAIPAQAGKREVVATLQQLPGSCPGRADDQPDDPDALASLGFLSLASRPAANVFIDGVDIGRTTPLRAWPLKVGKHRVRIALKGKSKEVTIEIKGGQTHSEIIDLRRR